jgi:probable HAF family extracellular repeat protein
MRRFALLVAGAVALVASVVAPAPLGLSEASSRVGVVQSRWVITDLGTLPSGKESQAVAINDRGAIVGWSRDAAGKKRAVRWQSGKPADLGTIAGRTSEATAINGRGQIVGWTYTTDYKERPFLWEHGRLTVLDRQGERLRPSTFGSWHYIAFALNEHGQILVRSDPQGPGGINRAFLWQNGRLADLGTLGGRYSATEAVAINQRGQIVGSSDIKDIEYHAFLWANGKMRDLGTLGGRHSFAAAINERGQIVGSSKTGADDWHAFMWWKGKLTDLGMLPGQTESEAVAINERGQIVGSSGATDAFLWKDGRLTDLGTLGGKEWAPVAINERGQIIGNSDVLEVSNALVCQNGKTTALPTLPGGKSSKAVAMNERGQIIGWGTTKTGKHHAVLWTLKPGS